MEAEYTMDQSHDSFAHRNAEAVTSEILEQLDKAASNDAGMALIYGNSALAAVEILFRKHGINKDLALPMYKEYWSPFVDRTEPN